MNKNSVDYEGRVEIYLHGQWGTVCDDLWDIRDATVVCSQLGYLDATSAEIGAKFGQGRGVIHLNNVNCLGNETALTDCPAKKTRCDHSKDAGVRCNPRRCPSGMLTSI